MVATPPTHRELRQQQVISTALLRDELRAPKDSQGSGGIAVTVEHWLRVISAASESLLALRHPFQRTRREDHTGLLPATGVDQLNLGKTDDFGLS